MTLVAGPRKAGVSRAKICVRKVHEVVLYEIALYSSMFEPPERRAEVKKSSARSL